MAYNRSCVLYPKAGKCGNRCKHVCSDIIRMTNFSSSCRKSSIQNSPKRNLRAPSWMSPCFSWPWVEFSWYYQRTSLSWYIPMTLCGLWEEIIAVSSRRLFLLLLDGENTNPCIHKSRPSNRPVRPGSVKSKISSRLLYGIETFGSYFDDLIKTFSPMYNNCVCALYDLPSLNPCNFSMRGIWNPSLPIQGHYGTVLSRNWLPGKNRM